MSSIASGRKPIEVMAPEQAAGPVVRFRRIRPDAILPQYHSEHAAGMDLAACIADGGAVDIPVGEIRLFDLGFAMAIPEGFEAQVRPRSGLGSKHGITLPNAPGTIDSDYRGEVKVPLINHGQETFRVEHGMRIAQMVIAPVARARVVEVESLEETARGEGGFGSTGSCGLPG